MVRVGRCLEFTFALALQPLLRHQTTYTRTTDCLTIFDQILANTPCTIGLSARLVDLLHFFTQSLVFETAGALRPFQPVIVGALGDIHHVAHPGHCECPLVAFDKGVLHELSFAKYAAAFFRISRSSVKRLFSLRNLFNSS